MIPMVPKQPSIPEMPPARPVKETGETWFCCPRCKAKLFKLRPYARAEGLEIKCRKCKKIINVSL